MKKEFGTFLYAVLAGGCVSLGGCAFLSLENKVLGALFFVIGLFAICTFGFHLFTGKVCYLFENDLKYAMNTLLIWLGNLAGCVITSGLLHLTRISPAITERAKSIIEIKYDDDLLSIFILAIFCNICIYIAVDGFRNNPHELGKYLSIFFGVMVFILCGFEHCVANMFYITTAYAWNGETVLLLIVNTLGNAVGGLLIPAVKQITKNAG